MRVVTVSPVLRLIVAGAVSLVLVAGAAETGASSAPAPRAPAVRPLVRPASLGPHGTALRLGPAQVTQAAQACASAAATAGWANNGQYGGDLVIAVAVCIAESGGQPNIYYCDGTGLVAYYPPVNCPTGSYDRGLWQINSKYHPGVTDACAFQAQCNAAAAYPISYQGTDFAPWAVYDTNLYARYLGAAQRAVAGLTAGTVSAALFGVCAVPAQQAPGAAVTVGRCGRNVAAQQWTVTGGTLRQGGLCLAAAAGPGSAPPAVAASACDGTAGQTWAPDAAGELRNTQSGLCLNDPHGRRAAGTALNLTTCAGKRRQTWWLP